VARTLTRPALNAAAVETAQIKAAPHLPDDEMEKWGKVVKQAAITAQ